MEFSDLSRSVSHALRHEPWLYELELDNEGWVSIADLVSAIRGTEPNWAGLTEADVLQMIAVSAKRRHEVQDGRIRALYGHSVVGRLSKTPSRPPDELFHGTAKSIATSIQTLGLMPMGRQYVHMSTDRLTAAEVGRRKSKDVAIFRILAAEAYSNGVSFYIGNEIVWLADRVPTEFIAIDDFPT